MTSSPERAAWRPIDLASSRGGGGDAAAAVATADWLPSLREPRDELQALALEQAFQMGYDAAVRAERERLESESRRALATLARVADQLVLLQTDFARDRERDLHTLAVAIARQVVQHELTVSADRLSELVRAALELLPLDPRIEVRLNPDDLSALGSTLEGLAPAGRGLDLVWVADAVVERGGFVLETPQRIIDGRADVALRELWERLGHD